MSKITPFLWFDGNAEEAVNFYAGIFKSAKIVDTMRYGDAGPGPKGSVMLVNFELEGQHFTALNGGPEFSFTPAVSFFITCETQEEIDAFWDRLGTGGNYLQCGWLTDKYGLTWQIVPSILLELLRDPDTAKSQRVTAAMMTMTKLDIAGLKRAAGL